MNSPHFSFEQLNVIMFLCFNEVPSTTTHLFSLWILSIKYKLTLPLDKPHGLDT